MNEEKKREVEERFDTVLKLYGITKHITMYTHILEYVYSEIERAKIEGARECMNRIAVKEYVINGRITLAVLDKVIAEMEREVK